jgi:hypothetical protein
MNYKVELSDDDGKNFRINISVPFDIAGTDSENSSWRVETEGFIKFRSGGCGVGGSGWATPLELRLARGGQYGVKLTNFTDWMRLVNQSGSGYVYQSWCVGFKPGNMTWVLID